MYRFGLVALREGKEEADHHPSVSFDLQAKYGKQRRASNVGKRGMYPALLHIAAC
jgi:hypothetical protein